MTTQAEGPENQHGDDDADFAEYIEEIFEAFELDDQESEVVAVLVGLHQFAQGLLADVIEGAMADGGDPLGPELFGRMTPVIVEALGAEGSEVAAAGTDFGMLHRPHVAQAFATIALDQGPAGTLGLQLVASGIGPIAPHQARAALMWLDGRGADRAGNGLLAEACFEQALSVDPSWAPALESLADLAGDRGDADRALSLLDRAGIDPDDGLYRLLLTYRQGGAEPVRRNDPCWCGSGRKVKQCHRSGPPLPLNVRASWLYHKASAFLQDGPWRMDILELASERSRYGGKRELVEALGDPLIMSSMLFEGDVLEDFAETRGPLLPPDEYALLERWMDVDRGLYEVEEVRRGEGVLVRNVLDGERTFVHEVLGSQQAHVGMLFVALVLPLDDEQWGFFGGIEPVSLAQRQAVIELLDDYPEPLELVAMMTDRFAPPRLTTKDGSNLAPKTTVIKVKGRKLIDRAFDAQFTRDGEASWTAGVDGGEVGEGGSIGGFIRVNGREVTIETLSAERMDFLLEVIGALGFDFTVMSEKTMDVHAELADRHAQIPPQAKIPDLEDPQMVAILEEVVRKYEIEWLESSIPALDGLTPRQAAADPVMRRDLIALLNSFPPVSPGMMDPDRLRAALGL